MHTVWIQGHPAGDEGGREEATFMPPSGLRLAVPLPAANPPISLIGNACSHKKPCAVLR